MIAKECVPVQRSRCVSSAAWRKVSFLQKYVIMIKNSTCGHYSNASPTWEDTCSAHSHWNQVSLPYLSTLYFSDLGDASVLPFSLKTDHYDLRFLFPEGSVNGVCTKWENEPKAIKRRLPPVATDPLDLDRLETSDCFKITKYRIVDGAIL